MVTQNKNWEKALHKITKANKNSSKSLSLRFLQLTQIPSILLQLKNLTELLLWDNSLTELPADISQLQSLESLYLSNNELTQFPLGITQLKNLRTLYLSKNQLSQFPQEITQLENLQILCLNHNQLTRFPIEIASLENLQMLFLRKNQLTELPIQFTQLKNLRYIDLSDNQLSHFPREINQIKSLEYLDLSNNKLDKLCLASTEFQNLKYLDLRNNCLSELTSNILKLNYLPITATKYFSGKGINIYGNEKTLQHPPIEIIQQGWTAIENYFEQFEQQGKDKLYEAKLIFIGEGRAGKTSLMNALLGKPFDKNESSTEGIEIANLVLPKEETGFEKDFRLNLWDFGGQEIYKDTHRFFLTKDTIYILVTENRKNINYDDIYYWLNGINIFAPDTPVLLVQNKCEENIEDLRFQSYKRDFKNLVPWSNLLRTSCHAGHEGSIVKLRQTIVKVLQDEDLAPNVGDDIPATWVDIRQDLAKMQEDGQATLGYKEFEKLCMERYGLKDELSVKTLAGYFFRIGVFTHYEDNLTLEDTIFLDNEWLTKGVYRIIDSQIVKDKKGRFTTTDLKALYKGTFYEGLEAKFAELMHEFKICYRVTKNEYLCPLRLPVEEPESFNWKEWQRAKNLHYAFEYPFMPRGILTTFIVNIHPYIIGKSWKHGVVLQHNKAQALVYEDLQAKYIHIYIKGEDKRDFLAIIVSTLQDIHQELNDLPHEAKIACFCEQCIANPAKAHLFDAEIVLRRYTKGIATITCDKSDAEVSIPQLAGFIKGLHLKNDDTLKTVIHNVEELTLVGRDMEKYIFQKKVEAQHIGDSQNSSYQQNNGISTTISDSHVRDFTIKDNEIHNQNIHVDKAIFTNELAMLVDELRKQTTTSQNPEVFTAIGKALEAQTALQEDGHEKRAVQILKSGGHFLLNVAKAVGASLLAQLLLSGG